MYNKLLKIKKPVLIEVKRDNESEYFHRLRILYPNGRCEFITLMSNYDYPYSAEFSESCFSLYSSDMKGTIEGMKFYDETYKIKIVNIKEL